MNTKVNIWSIIREVFLEKKKAGKISVTKFAEELGIVRSRVYPIFESRSIDSDLLIRISKILDYPFLLEYFEENKPIVIYLAIIEADSKRIEELKSDPSLKIIKTWSSVWNSLHRCHKFATKYFGGLFEKDELCKSLTG